MIGEDDPNHPPTATISSPASNMTIIAGQAVNFQGSGTDPDGNTPLTYQWNFGGGALNSTALSPGSVTFPTAGTYVVNFTVTDSFVGWPLHPPPVPSLSIQIKHLTARLVLLLATSPLLLVKR